MYGTARVSSFWRFKRFWRLKSKLEEIARRSVSYRLAINVMREAGGQKATSHPGSNRGISEV
jgi:hypothetical protein